jgi:hypothetical protein
MYDIFQYFNHYDTALLVVVAYLIYHFPIFVLRNTRHWYRLVLSDKERKQAKLDALRKEKESQELSECTFRPSLHKKDFLGSARVKVCSLVFHSGNAIFVDYIQL